MNLRQLRSVVFINQRRRHYIISFLVQLFMAGFFIYHWDGFVLVSSVQQFLQGITPYEMAEIAPPYIYHSHELPWWYAYPPLPLLMMTVSYAPFLHILGDNLILQRVFVTMPFILGNLLCASLVYSIVSGVTSEDRASKAEKIILYNPFLILITAVRGMFDIWMVALLLLSILYLRKNKYCKAGVCFGLGLLIKPIIVIFIPIFLIYTWNRSGNLISPRQFFTWAVAVFGLVCLPFFISDPHGFVYQTVLLHVERPPSGYTLPSLLYMGDRSIFSNVSSSVISTLFGLISLLAIGCVTLYLRVKRTCDEKNFMASLFLVMLLFTLLSKVVNPQYFVTPLVLAVVILYTYKDGDFISRSDIKRYYKLLVIPFVGATILQDGIYYGLLPPDIAVELIGKTAAQLELQVANSMPFSPNFYYLLLSIGCGILVVPALVLTAIISYRGIKHMIPSVVILISNHLSRRIPSVKRPILWRFAGVSLAFLLLTVPVLSGLISYWNAVEAQEEQESQLAPTGDKMVGVFYHYWWHNSTHDPSMQSDNWLAAKFTPEEGYYDLNPAYMSDDIRLMKDANIDFAVVSFSSIYQQRYQQFVHECEEQGLYFAPMVEVHDFLIDQPSPDDEEFLFDKEVERDLLGKLDSVLRQKDSLNYLRYEGKPIVFIHNSQYLPDGEPCIPDENFWPDIIFDIEQKHGEIYWIADMACHESIDISANFDDVFFLPSLATANSVDTKTIPDTIEQCTQCASMLDSQLCIGTVMPGYDHFEANATDEKPITLTESLGIYDHTWETVLKGEFDMVLIFSWNEYFGGACIEPTKEFGSALLEHTRIWTDMYTSNSIRSSYQY